jgi:hypothetical protein
MWTDDLVTLLTDAGFGGLGVDITIGGRAQKLDSPGMLASGVVSIRETSAGGPERTNNSVIRPAYIHVGAQISVRANSSLVAKARAQKAYNALVGIRNVRVINNAMTISGWYREINPLSEPYDMTLDDKGLARYGFTVVAIRRP